MAYMNKMADYVSKIIDKDDWETTDEFVTDWMLLPEATGLLKQGNSKLSLLGSDKYKGGLMALKIRS